MKDFHCVGILLLFPWQITVFKTSSAMSVKQTNEFQKLSRNTTRENLNLLESLCVGYSIILEGFSAMLREADRSVSQTNSQCNTKGHKIAKIAACGQTTVLEGFTANLRQAAEDR